MRGGPGKARQGKARVFPAALLPIPHPAGQSAGQKKQACAWEEGGGAFLHPLARSPAGQPAEKAGVRSGGGGGSFPPPTAQSPACQSAKKAECTREEEPSSTLLPDRRPVSRLKKQACAREEGGGAFLHPPGQAPAGQLAEKAGMRSGGGRGSLPPPSCPSAGPIFGQLIGGFKMAARVISSVTEGAKMAAGWGNIA